MKIPLMDLKALQEPIQEELEAAALRVLRSCGYILGPEVRALEEEVAAYIGVAHGVGVASGTDALILALRALEIGPGDEVIIPSYTFFATAEAVSQVGATPRFVDIELDSYGMDPESFEEAVTDRTKAVIPVHLYGHPARMDRILEIAHARGIKVVEDNAQAMGATWDGRKTGSLGDVGCLSFFPSKTLGGSGDGGMIVTDDEAIAARVRRLRVHGWEKKYRPEEIGYNSRLDALQAAILRVKLPQLDQWTRERRRVTELYDGLLGGKEDLILPRDTAPGVHAYHLFVVRTSKRDELESHLLNGGIATGRYYPLPIHQTRPYWSIASDVALPKTEEAVRTTLAIPHFPGLGSERVEEIAARILQVVE